MTQAKATHFLLIIQVWEPGVFVVLISYRGWKLTPTRCWWDVAVNKSVYSTSDSGKRPSIIGEWCVCVCLCVQEMKQYKWLVKERAAVSCREKYDFPPLDIDVQREDEWQEIAAFGRSGEWCSWQQEIKGTIKTGLWRWWGAWVL